MDRHLEYDVALSFAGEDRAHAEALASTLRSSGVRVFYDEFYQATLWGKDLFQHLQSVYRDRAKYCVVFVSEKYIEKSWTKHELQQAQARSFDIDREYILPLRLDDANLPGLNRTIGYLDLRKITITQVTLLLLEKLGLPAHGLEEETDRAEWNGEFTEYNGAQVASFWPKQIERAQHQPAYLVTRPMERIRYGSEKRMWAGTRRTRPRLPCGDCAAVPGQFHVPSCDMEECPACGRQAISCGCLHEPMTRDRVKAWDEGDEEGPPQSKPNPAAV